MTNSTRLAWGLTAVLLIAGSASVGPATSAQSASGAPVSRIAPHLSTSNEPVVSNDEFDDLPTIELSGELQVAIIEHAATTQDDADAHLTEEYAFAVLTDDGELVAITGDLPSETASGSTFAGEVAVPAAVSADVSQEAQEALEGAVEVPLHEDSVAAQETTASASALGTVLPITEARLAAQTTSSAAAFSHQYYVAIVDPIGTTPSTYTEATVQAVVDESAQFWTSASRGQIPAFRPAAPVKRYSSAYPCDANPFVRWQEASSKFGFSSTGGFFAGYGRHLIVVLPEACADTAGIGVGTVGDSLHEGGFAQATLGVDVDRSTIAHELGHNLSLGHSNARLCGAASCSEVAYGDVYDVMGAAMTGADGLDTLTALNARTQLALGFLQPANTAAFALGTTETTKTKSFTLAAIDSSAPVSGVMALRVTDPSTGETFAVEYRAGAGQDAKAVYTEPQYSIYFDGSILSLGTGVRVLADSPDNGSSVIAWRPNATGAFAQATSPTSTAFRNVSNSIKAVVTSMSGTAAQVAVTLTAPEVPAAATAQPVYRFWSNTKQAHFFTISASERDAVIADYPDSVWKYERIAYTAFTHQAPGTVPLYRFWSDSFQGHFYTANEAEKNAVIRDYPDSIWKFERTAYFVYPSSYVGSSNTVYRFWSASKRHHFFTASAAERDSVIRDYADDIWLHEGARFKVPVG